MPERESSTWSRHRERWRKRRSSAGGSSGGAAQPRGSHASGRGGGTGRRVVAPGIEVLGVSQGTSRSHDGSWRSASEPSPQSPVVLRNPERQGHPPADTAGVGGDRTRAAERAPSAPSGGCGTDKKRWITRAAGPALAAVDAITVPLIRRALPLGGPSDSPRSCAFAQGRRRRNLSARRDETESRGFASARVASGAFYRTHVNVSLPRLRERGRAVRVRWKPRGRVIAERDGVAALRLPAGSPPLSGFTHMPGSTCRVCRLFAATRASCARRS